MYKPLTDHKVLVFDVYATLIDWEAGIYKALEPLLSRFPPSVRWTRDEALLAFASVEYDLEVQYPGMLYSDLLSKIYEVLAERLKALAGDEDGQGVVGNNADARSAIPGESAASTSSADAGSPPLPHRVFAESIRHWPLFPDTYAALQTLSKHFKLVVLSNVDRVSFGYTHALLSEEPNPDPTSSPSLYAPPVLNSGQYWFPRTLVHSKSPFSLIMTAQDTGFYKPALEGFQTVLETVRTNNALLAGQGPGGRDLTLEEVKEKVLIVAKSIQHDIVPAGKLGLRSVWIERPGTGAATGAVREGGWTWTYKTLGDFAEAVEAEKSTGVPGPFTGSFS
ncbi:HAD-like protein [Pluteus cervinus]|uniref:HAD-like protein n=1 Tax=Pluteus cervinus TaxID=181527 RepID=A0ACD3B3C7_9AGAR|nr:HAD-like protein [Pluteus cervinus]